MHRRYHHDEITFRSMYAFSERYVLPLSHDEVVHGKGSLLDKMPGDEWQRFANLRLLYGTMWAQPGKKLLFMGGELGAVAEWAHEGMIDWALHDAPDNDGIRRLVADLNAAYQARGGAAPRRLRRRRVPLRRRRRRHPQRVRLATSRPDGRVAGRARRRQRHAGGALRLPRRGSRAGEWTEILNTDAADYGGSGVGNLGLVLTEDQQWHGFPQSLALTVPPLAVVYLRQHP